MTYIKGSKGYPYKRRRVHPANRPASPLDDLLEIALPDCSCQTSTCSNIQFKYWKENPGFVPSTRPVGRIVQAQHSVRLPRIFVVGADEAEREREARVRKKRPVESPHEDVVMDELEVEEEEEEELVLTRDPNTQYYYYEAMPDPNLEIVSTEPFVVAKFFFDPADMGSFPPKASDLMMFRETKRKRFDQATVDELEDEETPQPERENPPDLTLPPDAVRPARRLRLKYFDNPTLELRHPSLDLKEVTPKYGPVVPPPFSF